MPLDIQREIAALPKLRYERDTEDVSSDTALTPLDIVARQGRLIMRLSAASESLDRRFEELGAVLGEREAEIARLRDARQEAERQARQASIAAIHLMDALDWIHDSLVQQGYVAFAREVESAQRDCLRRLATVGITEIPAHGQLDGRLHQGVDTVETGDVPKYHIVSVVRRGFQSGQDILRPAEVITAL